MKLAKYLSDNSITETAFSQDERVSVSQVTINRYIRNERFPDPEMIERIAFATGGKVTFVDWYEQAAEARRAKEPEGAANA